MHHSARATSDLYWGLLPKEVVACLFEKLTDFFPQWSPESTVTVPLKTHLFQETNKAQPEKHPDSDYLQ